MEVRAVVHVVVTRVLLSQTEEEVKTEVIEAGGHRAVQTCTVEWEVTRVSECEAQATWDTMGEDEVEATEITGGEHVAQVTEVTGGRVTAMIFPDPSVLKGSVHMNHSRYRKALHQAAELYTNQILSP